MKSFDLGGNGAPLHFLHANGYPPGCYKLFFELLKNDYWVFGMLLRPLWEDAKPEDIKTWHPLSDDLLRFLSDRGSDPVIGVGHSIGAIVTLRAALLDREKFRVLILIDPVLFVPPVLVYTKIARMLGLRDRTQRLIHGALNRRRHFDDRESLFQGYRKRKIFRYMGDESLRAHIEGITIPKPDGGFGLAYSPEWEARIYRTGMNDFDIWRGLRYLDVPTLFIRGAETNTFWENAAGMVKRINHKLRVEVLENSTHLLPLERPGEVYDIMQSFLKEVP